MNKEQDGIEYLDELSSKLSKYMGGAIVELGNDLQKGTKLSKTDRGARTNARIEASQKKEPFNESETPKDELNNVENDVTSELLNRALKEIFGE